ncbi:MAG: sigma-54 factor interaction domain-containing protein, partial [Pyrinomonadaceae bacterium]|nr:sigma-54 factor interaction domain-containing protein [Pyrinomonadaceae bacterium]
MAIEQAASEEAALHLLADFVTRRGHIIRRIECEVATGTTSIERTEVSASDALGCEIVVTAASRQAQLTITLARRPNADEGHWLEMAGHKAVLRVEEFARRQQHGTRCLSTCDTGDEDCSSNYKSDLVGNSAPMKRLAGAIQKIAPLNSTVLILGETGTGKELVARAIHQNSPRANKPFITVNCNALTETIFDSQLMGHVRGAFTGAHRDELGAVRAAAGGTLFLDEVGDVPLPLQGKLLRVLQERVVTPLGTSKEHKVDVRFVAATNKDLLREGREGRFRDDLYRRLRVQEIITPTLRVRL